MEVLRTSLKKTKKETSPTSVKLVGFKSRVPSTWTVCNYSYSGYNYTCSADIHVAYSKNCRRSGSQFPFWQCCVHRFVFFPIKGKKDMGRVKWTDFMLRFFNFLNWLVEDANTKKSSINEKKMRNSRNWRMKKIPSYLLAKIRFCRFPGRIWGPKMERPIPLLALDYRRTCLSNFESYLRRVKTAIVRHATLNGYHLHTTPVPKQLYTAGNDSVSRL